MSADRAGKSLTTNTLTCYRSCDYYCMLRCKHFSKRVQVIRPTQLLTPADFSGDLILLIVPSTLHPLAQLDTE